MNSGETSQSNRTELRIGVFLPQIHSWPEMADHARLIERLGFDSLWLGDQFFSTYSATGNWFECWTTLSALAAVTSTIRLGPGITHIIYRNPAIVARAALTVDHVSGGRLNLGIGVGSAIEYNYAMTGIGDRELKERVDRYKEAVLLIDQLLRLRETTYSGSYYWVKEASMNPAPIQQPRPPLNLAAHHPLTLRFAAQYGDAWNCFYPGKDLTPEQSSAAITQLSRSLSEMAEGFGRDPAAIGRTFFSGYTFDTPFASAAALDNFVGRYVEAGINEIVFTYTPGLKAKELALKWIVNADKLQEVAAQLLPTDRLP